MSTIAAIRPDGLHLPLFLHVLGALVTVGALVLAATYLIPAWRQSSVDSLRLAYRTLLWVAVPSFLVMRIAAQWLFDKEGLDELAEDPGWIGIGFMTSDFGAVLLVIATVVTGVGVRRASAASGGGGVQGARAAAVIVGVLLVLYVVAIWAMTTKPA